MTIFNKHLVAASLLATLSLAAVAQISAQPAAAAAAPTRDGRLWHDPARMEEHRSQRQAALKQKLQLTSAQEGAWTSFVTAMKPPANWVRPDRAALAGLATPERIDQMRALRNQRLADMDRRGDATKAFYGMLTTEQKKVFDAETAAHGHRRHHGHGDKSAG